MRLTGQVEGGHGNASRRLSAFNAAYSRKIGTPIFPGTLNLRLAAPFDWRAPAIQAVTIEFPREHCGGERDILLVPCRLVGLDGLDAHVWTTSRVLSDPEPPHVIEVIASVGLRAKYGLEDGDSVELEIAEECPARTNR